MKYLLILFFTFIISNPVYAAWDCEKEFKSVGDEWGYQQCLKDQRASDQSVAKPSSQTNSTIAQPKSTQAPQTQSLSERIAKLESELQPIYPGSYTWFRMYARPMYTSDDNFYSSTEWEARLKKELVAAKKQVAIDKQAELDHQRCLNSGEVGICQSSAQNQTIFLCDQNFIVAFNNLGNQYCYTTDNYNISTSMEVKNNTNMPVKDITFECAQIARSGTVLSRQNQTIYDIWQPKEIRRVQIKLPKQSQVESMQCQAVRWAN